MAKISAPRPRVVVVGAGAFGGWAALYLLRGGAQVTLCDSWGSGNSRSSSGGETRIIRATYGRDREFVELVARSLRLWRENETRWGRKLYHRTGSIWMAGADDGPERAALPLLRESGLLAERLSPAEAAKCYPQVNFEGVNWVLREQDAGYLLARRACEAVKEGFVAEGGEYRQVAVTPGTIVGGEMRPPRTSDGATITADQYVFACGPWMGALFPEVVGDRIKATRQDVFFFGTPPGDEQFLPGKMPVWVDKGDRNFYGIPDNESRGFKIADNRLGPPFDPSSGERIASPDALREARKYLGFRFPRLREAPLVESRVCQYEVTPDRRFILDRHPRAENVWLVGGGSGHGFKHGPAIGERTADSVLGRKPPGRTFSLSRFASPQF